MEDMKLTFDPTSHTFKEPKKCIHENADLEKFLKSNACGMLVIFI